MESSSSSIAEDIVHKTPTCEDRTSRKASEELLNSKRACKRCRADFEATLVIEGWLCNMSADQLV